MYLVDTSVWLEVLLEQDNAVQAAAFLQRTPSNHLSISDFSVFSVGIILFRAKEKAAFSKFLTDLETNQVGILRFEPSDLMKLKEVTATFNLDFDDAYQYILAEKHDLAIVSFDRDFDKTGRGKKTPQDCV